MAANPGQSGGDPRGRTQNQSQYQQNRFEDQQGPAASMFARNAARGAESNYGDYGDIMGKYRDVYSAAGGGGSGGGGGGFAPSMIGYKDPFNSYAGFTEFSKTGGYSPQDIANMRSRGISPIRATYANAEREIGRQRSLQGGYSPNAVAALAKMAREQGQGAADATQNVEAGLAEARNKGRLSGLSGMSDIEKQRLAADLEVGKFNAQASMAAGASGRAAEEANRTDQLRALSGMTGLYGTTPGMAELFGNQLNTSIGQGAQFGLGLLGQDIESQKLPGQWETVNKRANNVADWVNTGIGMYDQFNQNRKKNQTSVYQPKVQPYDRTGGGGVNYD